MHVEMWRYRWRQFAKASRGSLTRQELQQVGAILEEPLMSMFLGMTGVAQRHGYDVLAALRARGRTDRDLLAAALLHDCGKGRIGVVPRVIWVLTGGFAPGLRERLSEGTLGRRSGLWQLKYHAALGARELARAGASPITIWLVEHHEVRGHADPVLRALQEADDDN